MPAIAPPPPEKLISEASFWDMEGRPLWSEERHRDQRIPRVGETVWRQGKAWHIRRFVLAAGTLHVNVTQRE